MSDYLKVVDLDAARIIGCSCGATCPIGLNCIPDKASHLTDDDWFNDHAHWEVGK